MQYAPLLESSNPIKEYKVGDYKVTLYDNIISRGPVKYLYMMVALDENEEILAYVMSEVNPMAKRFGGGSHFLGVFNENGHINEGGSDDWADEEKFTARALEIISKKSDAETNKRFRANAEMVIQELRPISGMAFGYTKDSVEWLEGYIERLRLSGAFDNEETKDKLAGMFGSFLGECIRECYGGNWGWHDGFRCISFNEGNTIFPISKAGKQMDNGLEDGIGSFFRGIAVLYSEHIRPQPSSS
jgi:hypothetical protein